MGRRLDGFWLFAAIYDGATRTDAAKIGGVGLQIIRDRVLRFNARGSDSLLDGKSPGQPSRLNDAQRQAIGQIIENGPISALHGVVRWRLVDLAQWIFEEFRITIAKQTLSRELRAMGYRKLSARPRHHAKAEAAVEHFKKASPEEPTLSSLSIRLDGICPQDWSFSTNISIFPMPPKSPELNPVENIWQFMRDNWLSNRVFKSYDDLVDHCCDAWNKLVDMPWRIMSIGLRQWAHGF